MRYCLRRQNIDQLEAISPPLAFLLTAHPIPKAGSEELLFVYGAGLVDDGGKRVVFFESDPDRLHMFLETGYAKRLFDEERIAIFSPNEEGMKGAIWSALFKTFEVYQNKQEGFDSFHSAFLQMHASIHLVVSSYRDFGKSFLANLFGNAALPHFDGLALKGALEGVPAIVCGSGPSLDRHKEALEKEEGLILACGSAMHLLPFAHAGVAIDPDPPAERYCDWTGPIFYQNRFSNAILSEMEGVKIRMGHNGAYPLEEAVAPTDFFDPGWNAGTFGVMIAKYLGCAPIVTLGIDHAGEYAEGVEGEKAKGDMEVAREFLEGVPPYEPGNSHGAKMPECFFDLPQIEDEIDAERFWTSLEKCAEYAETLTEGANALSEVELDGEFAYRKFLKPLWEIWGHILDDEYLFILQVVDEVRAVSH